MLKTYEQLEEEKRNRIRKGDFEGARLADIFSNQKLDEIDDVLEGLDRKMDQTVLSLVILLAHRMYIAPNASEFDSFTLKGKITETRFIPNDLDVMTYDKLVEYWNNRIKNKMEDVLCRTIKIARKYCDKDKNNIYPKAIYFLENHASEKVRLHYCANINYEQFLKPENEPSFRIRKVAEQLSHFYRLYFFYDADRVAQINYLVAAINTGAIELHDGDVSYENIDIMHVSFSSPLMVHSLAVPKFDRNLVYTIQDKRVLADELLTYISSGKLVFHPGILPSYFESALPREEEPNTGGKKHK